MLGVNSDLIATTYLNLTVKNFKFLEPQRGRGGSITNAGDFLVVGTSENTFIKIDPLKMVYEINFLPKLETGEKELQKSKRYKLIELKPRIDGLVFNNGIYYVAYTAFDKNSDFIHFKLAKISEKGKKWVPIWVSPGLDAPYFALGTGGKISILQDRLYFTLGDFSLDRINGLASDIAAQNINLPWGKVNYIDLIDNSFHVFTIGHRNPQGFLIMNNGDFLVAEHGPKGGDELNILEKGANYGWPFESFGTKYDSFGEYRDDLPSPDKSLVFTPPVYSFLPSPAVTQLIQMSNFHKKWDGNILLGSLKAMTLFHINISDRKVIFSEPIKIGYRVRDMTAYKDQIFILTDSGTILVLNGK